MADQLKLQAAPLTALQLELSQARLDVETMRDRLREERKEGRLRYKSVFQIAPNNLESEVRAVATVPLYSVVRLGKQCQAQEGWSALLLSTVRQKVRN